MVIFRKLTYQNNILTFLDRDKTFFLYRICQFHKFGISCRMISNMVKIISCQIPLFVILVKSDTLCLCHICLNKAPEG